MSFLDEYNRLKKKRLEEKNEDNSSPFINEYRRLQSERMEREESEDEAKEEKQKSEKSLYDIWNETVNGKPFSAVEYVESIPDPKKTIGWGAYTAASGLNNFNRNIAATTNLILGKPLQELGWKDNPITELLNFFNGEYEKTRAMRDKYEQELGGGKKLEIAGDIMEGTFAALPDAILAMMTAGTSTAATTGSLATKAAYESGSILSKAGITVQQMMKNPQYWFSFAQTYGNDYEEAKEKGADDVTAAIGSTISSLINAGIEIGVDGASGIQGLPDKVAEGNKTAIREWVKSSIEEGNEEVLQSFVNNLVSKTMYDKDTELFNLKDMAMDFGMGAAVGGILGGAQIGAQKVVNAAQNATQAKQDSVMTDSEKMVVDKVSESRISEEESKGKSLTEKEKETIHKEVIEDMKKGAISTDTIESILAEDTYKEYKGIVDSETSMKEELKTLQSMEAGKMNDLQRIRMEELKGMNLKDTSKRDAARSKLDEEVFAKVNGSRLSESYNEKQRRGQAFTADLSKYSKGQRAAVQRAIESGILNNSNRTHEFVNLISKIEADKGVIFNFTDNEKLKKSGFSIEGKTINGFVTKDGITLNIDSAKSWQAVVGHEITHVLKGTEMYSELQNAITEYSKTKGDYQSRYDSISQLYRNIKGADIEEELTADLVGDYLFTDEDFVNHLFSNHRNLAQKIFDEIKYLYKLAKAGSKEAKQLEKAKNAFFKAYRQDAKVTTDLKYALTKYGFEELTKETRNNMKMQGVEVIDTKNDLIKKIEYSLNEKEKQKQKQFTLGAIGSGTKTKIESDINRKLFKDRQYSFIINTDDIIHISKHFGTYNEIADEVIRLFDIVSNYDSIEFKLDGDRKKLIFEKSYPHAEIRSVEVVSNNRNSINTVTVFYTRKNRSQSNPTATSNLNGSPRWGSASINMIQQSETEVKENNERDGDGNEISEKQDIVFSMSEPAEEAKDNSEKFGVRDSEGNKLSEKQEEYFKDSKVRDETGRLKIMYHGTPNGTFTIFKEGSYFTGIKEYADRYQNPSASSLKSGKEADNPKTYAVYLNIKKPFDIKDKKAREIYIEEYIKGGNAIGINPYLSDKEYDKIREIDWTEGEDLRDFLKDNNYDYDGLVLDEGADGGYGDEVKHRGVSYVIFDPAQVKDVENLNPTENQDIMFSMSETVEENKTLVAAHNFDEEKMRSSLKLGAFPSPSIAIVKADQGHSKYGDYSAIFRKNTIDPKEDKRNKVYGSDAWTPTESNARIEYEVKYDKKREIEKRISSLASGIAEGTFNRSGILSSLGIDDVTNLDLNEIARKMAGTDEVRAAYLADNGGEIEPVRKKKEYSKFGNVALQEYIDSMEESRLAKIVSEIYLGTNKADIIKQQNEAVRKIIRDQYEQSHAYTLNRKPELKEQRINRYMENNVSELTVEDFILDAWNYYDEGGAVTEEIDRIATSDNLRGAVDDKEVEAWIYSQLDGLIGEPGIYNGKEPYESNGNRKSFDKLHYAYTAENIVRAMQETASERGEGYLGAGAEGMVAMATSEYGSIDEIHKDENRLMTESEEDHKDRLESIDRQIENIISEIKQTNKSHSDNSWTESEIVGSILMDTAKKARKTKESVKREFLKEGYSIDDEIAGQIVSMYDNASRIPTGYFEAKPQRVVGFDEIAAVLAPDNAPKDLIQEMQNAGINVVTYQAGNEQARLDALNNLDDVRFSVSGKEYMYNMDTGTPLQELRYKGSDDIAPVREDAVKKSSAYGAEDAIPDDFAPIAENVTIQESKKMQQKNTGLYEQIDQKLAIDKEALKEEFEKKKEIEKKIIENKSEFVANMAHDLYVEIKDLKKGVRASNELGYLLDHGYQWSEIKKVLLNIKYHPDKMVNENDVLEQIARQMIDEEYEKHIYDYEELDAEYEKRVKELENEAEKKKNDERKSEGRISRAELHEQIVADIKAEFGERGFDFDKVLKKAKNLSTFATVDNTPQRVMEKALGYKEGKVLSDLTVNKVAQNETEGIKWLNSYLDRKNGILAQISRQYNIKPGTKESAAAQMYAEGFYVAKNNDIVKYGDEELMKDFKDIRVQEKIKSLARDPRIRKIYDETLERINQSRARNAYPEIPKRKNYFLHFREMNDTFSKLGLPFNPNDIRAKDLPTDLNGMTADLKPGQPYFASAKQRLGKRTSFDLLGGLERYLTSAKNQIYHIDDIQTLRALRNYIADTYGQASGLEGLDELSEGEVQERIEEVYGSHLSTFAKFLNEEANVIAGKTSLIDRGLEGVIGRRGMTFIDSLNKQVGSNMVGFNVSSAGTNFLPVVQAFAKTNKSAFVKGFAQTVSNRIKSIKGKSDGFAENNPTMIRRKGAERFSRKMWQKVGDLGYVMAGAVDSISTEIITRAKYNELIGKGMNEEKAIAETDKWVSRLMGDRTIGQQPQLYNSKMLGLITKFQLEVRNQLDSQFYDTIQEAQEANEKIENKLQRNAKTAAKVASTLTQLAIAQHLFGKAFEAIAGYNPAFDIIDVIIKAIGADDDDDSEDTVLDNVEQGFFALLEDLPYTSTLTGGRIPIESALPIEEFVNGKDKYGNDKSRWETLHDALPYYLLPGGYGQIKKTTNGLKMFDGRLPVPGSYTDSGGLRFPVEDTMESKLQAAVFGQWANENARDYFKNERAPLKEKQIQEFAELDIPIKEYWDYREGLSEKKELEDKFDYVAGLDLPVEKKNIMINNIVDRKEPVDLENYDDFSGYEEFDFATKNHEKYDFLRKNDITFDDYNRNKKNKEAYNWAFENQEKYTLSKAVTSDVITYRKYAKELEGIKADKYANGDTISGSRKAKVINYINNIDAEYGEKIIMLKSEYPSDNTYNNEIINYLNEREDISYEEMEIILKELGFVVSDGIVSWK